MLIKGSSTPQIPLNKKGVANEKHATSQRFPISKHNNFTTCKLGSETEKNPVKLFNKLTSYLGVNLKFSV